MDEAPTPGDEVEDPAQFPHLDEVPLSRRTQNRCWKTAIVEA